MAAPIGLIAGVGRFPVDVARGAAAKGHEVVVVGIRGLAEPELARAASRHVSLPLGQLEALLNTFREAGVKQVLMAGKVPKSLLVATPEALQLDARALALLRSLADRKDDSILGAIADTLESEGFQLLEQMALTPELWAPEGVLGSVQPSEEQLRDVAFGFPVAKALGDLDVGQTVVVQGRAVLALEAIEGTDAAIRRGAELGSPGVCVVKVAKPAQDPRFDVPAVGIGTLESLLAARAGLLAVEAGRTLWLDREEFVSRADAAGIALLGVAGEALSRGGS